MRNVIIGAAAGLLSSTALAQAGGIERAVFSPAFMFETGNHAELSFGNVSPSVSGSFMGLVGSGDMADSFSSVSAAVKTDVSETLSLGLLIDQPVGANVSYPEGTGYPFAGSEATITSTQVSAIALYRVAPAVSVYGGLRAEKVTGEAVVTIFGPPNYELEQTDSTGYGYLVGAAYEKPEIALRVALTYLSAIDHDFTANDSYSGLVGPANFTATVPQAIKLDVQSGIAKDTLVFGSIQWREWSAFDIITRKAPDPFAAIDQRVKLSTDNQDTVSYTLGLGRKLSDSFSGAISIGYEPASGDFVGNLSPTDGYKSLTLAGVYTVPNGPKISVGATYGLVGDAKTEGSPAGTTLGTFTDNSYLGFGVKVGWSF